jgi:hypothetical protein
VGYDAIKAHRFRFEALTYWSGRTVAGNGDAEVLMRRDSGS